MQYLTSAVFLMISTSLINAEPYQNEGHNRQLSVNIDHYNSGSGQDEMPIYTKNIQPSYPVVASHEVKNPVVDINGETMPITIRFNSKTSPVNILQNHIKMAGNAQKSSVVEEPNVLYLKIEKPVIQTVNEIISPRREVIRQIMHTNEVVKTVVAKHNGGAGNGDGGINSYNDNESHRGGGGQNANMHLYKRKDHFSSDSATNSQYQ